MMSFFAIGVILGLSAGFAPGPLLTVVISETLQRDIKSGVRVALAPMITDIPIILLTLFILGKLSSFHSILGAISLAGGFFILFMGYQSIRSKGAASVVQTGKPRSLLKGILANGLSPHPYLFWFSVGGPTISKAMNISTVAPFAFILSFYVFLVGSKVLLAILVGKSKSFLNGKIYIYIMRFLGLVLCALAVALFRDGAKLLAWI